MIFKNPSKKESSLELNIKGISIQKTQLIKFLGITLTPHLKWNEHCKDLIRRANSRLFQLWRLSNLNVKEESLILDYKSWIRPLFLYSNACWLDQSHALINKIQNVQNLALRICLRKPRWYQTQGSQSGKCSWNWPTGIFKGHSNTTYYLYQSWYIRNDGARSTLAKALLIIWITKSISRIHNRLVAEMTVKNSDQLNKRRINPSLIPEIQYQRSSSFKQQKCAQWQNKIKNWEKKTMETG